MPATVCPSLELSTFNIIKAGKINYPCNDKYLKDYLEALERWTEGRHEDCVGAAKYNLTGPTLPRCFQIKNCIMIVLAEHDWAIAERFRLETERICAGSVSRMTPKPVGELRVLAGTRIELDELKEMQGKDPQLREVVPGEMASVEIKETTTLDAESKSELDGMLTEGDGMEIKFDEIAAV